MLHLNCGLENEDDMYLVTYEYPESLYKPYELVGIIVSHITVRDDRMKFGHLSYS